MTKEFYEKCKKALENDRLPTILKNLLENAVKKYEEQMEKTINAHNKGE